MTNSPVLRARNTPATAPVPASEADALMSVALREAKALASAGNAIPKDYRGNVGACFAVLNWAQHRNIDLLTAMAGVSFINGKPYIDATLQRALAAKAGYRVLIPNASAEAATAQVVDRSSGEVIGEATFTMKDAKAAGIADKGTWKSHTEDMLVARATTRAVRRFAPEVMVGLIVEDEIDEIMEREDPIAVLQQNAGEDQDPQTVDVAHNPVGESEEPSADLSGSAPESSPATPDDDAEDAEIVVDGEITPSTLMAVTEAMSAAKRRDNWGEIAQAMQAEGIEMVVKKMTEAEGKRALEMLK